MCVLAVFILEATDWGYLNIFLCNIWEKFTSFPFSFSLYPFTHTLGHTIWFLFGSIFRAIVGHTLSVAVKISSTKVTTADQVEKHSAVNIYLWIMKE